MEDLVPYGGVSAQSVAGLFDPDSPESLTKDERTLLSALITTTDNLTEILPDTLSAQEIWQSTQLCSTVFTRIRRASAQLKVLIGRCLILIQNSPMVYEERGFRSFDQFMSDETTGLPFLTGISRGELYKAKGVAEAAPGLSLSDAQNVGWTKLSLLTSKKVEGDSDFKDLLESAKTDTIPQFQERLYRSDMLIPRGNLEFDVLQLTVTKDQKTRFEEFTANPKIQAHCGTKSQGEILQRLIDEAENEWLLEEGVNDMEASLPV